MLFESVFCLIVIVHQLIFWLPALCALVYGCCHRTGSYTAVVVFYNI